MGADGLDKMGMPKHLGIAGLLAASALALSLDATLPIVENASELRPARPGRLTPGGGKVRRTRGAGGTDDRGC